MKGSSTMVSFPVIFRRSSGLLEVPRVLTSEKKGGSDRWKKEPSIGEWESRTKEDTLTFDGLWYDL